MSDRSFRDLVAERREAAKQYMEHPVVQRARDILVPHALDEVGFVVWLTNPSRYFHGVRAIDVLATDPERVVESARHELECRVYAH